MKIRCPRCAAEMVEVDLYRSSTEYCGNCGYGADLAARQLRAHMIGLWWASGVGLLFGLIAWKRGPVGLTGMALFAVGFFVLYPMGRGLVARYRLSKIYANTRRSEIGMPGNLTAPLNGLHAQEWIRKDDKQVWSEYYRLRNHARLSVLILPVALFALCNIPESLLLILNGFPPVAQLTIIFIIIGLGAILFSAPLLEWAEWKCPRCRHKFVQPRIYFGIFTLLLVLPKLVFDSSCAKCKLSCGAPMKLAHSQ
jgi:ribosomal protein L37E